MSNATILELINSQQPFEIETDVSDNAIREILMQRRRITCYHSKKLSRVFLSYPTYEKDLYALVQAMKK